jgi:hypothetical protein
LRTERAPRWETKPSTGSTRTTRWMVARDGGKGRLEPLCVRAGLSKVLPVFSFEEEAEMFLHLGGYADSGWRVRESSAGELVSVLCGPCADVEGVALDPLPEMLEDGTIELVEVGRRRFVEHLLERGANGLVAQALRF